MDAFVEVLSQWGVTGVLFAIIIAMGAYFFVAISSGNLVLKSVHEKLVEFIENERNSWKESSDRKESVIEKLQSASEEYTDKLEQLATQLEVATHILEAIQEYAKAVEK